MNFRNALIAISLGSVACGATALSLGNARGVVVLGRPVDLAFDVHLDPGKLPEDACITADMVSGTTPVASARVRVAPLPQMPGRPAAVRVLSTFVADEPVLTVTLHVGCSGKVSRTYTFLADLPEALAASARPVAIPSAVPAEAVAGVAPGPASAAPAKVPAARRPAMALPVLPPGETATPPQRPARASQAPAPSGPSAAVAPRSKPAAPPARKPVRRAEADSAPVQAAPPSRLVMEPLDGWLEAPSQLRMTQQLTLPAASTTDQQRAQAQAEWQALSMQPQELLKEGARTATLQSELAQMRAQADKDRVATQQLLARLEKENAERYSGTIVYALLALVIAVLAWAAWMATRLRAASLQAQEAWAGAVAQQTVPRAEPEDDWVDSAPPYSKPDFLQSRGMSAPASLPSELPEPRVPEPVAPAPAAPVPPPPPPPSIPVAQPTLVVNAEELFDLQQQAEFFVSVGEHSQAIGVLKKYIAHNEATAPGAYLELLRLYRSLSRVDDFNQLRTQFHAHFNAQLPEFAAFGRPGRSLLGYPEVLAQVEAVWSDESVLPLLDGLLFRGAATVQDRFDLAAYDDLLLLNAIARTTSPSSRGAPPPRQRTTPQVAEDDAPAAPAAAPLPGPAPAAKEVDLLASDGLAEDGDSLLDYDSGWLLELPKGPAQPPAAPAAPKAPTRGDDGPPSLGIPLDFDLSDPFNEDPVPLPPITQSDLPPVPVTKGPPPGQAVGFGANSDRFEARQDPDERKPK